MDDVPVNLVTALDPDSYLGKTTSVNCSETHFIGCLVEVYGGAEYEETPAEDLDFLTYLTKPELTMDTDERPLLTQQKFQLVNAHLVSGKNLTPMGDPLPNTTDACKSTWDDGSGRVILSIQDATYAFHIRDSATIHDSSQQMIGKWETVRKGLAKSSLLIGAQPGVFMWSHHGESSCREWSSNHFNDMGPGLNSIDGRFTTRTCDSFGYIGCLVEVLGSNFLVNSTTLRVA